MAKEQKKWWTTSPQWMMILQNGTPIYVKSRAYRIHKRKGLHGNPPLRLRYMGKHSKDT